MNRTVLYHNSMCSIFVIDSNKRFLISDFFDFSVFWRMHMNLENQQLSTVGNPSQLMSPSTGGVGADAVVSFSNVHVSIIDSTSLHLTICSVYSKCGVWSPFPENIWQALNDIALHISTSSQSSDTTKIPITSFICSSPYRHEIVNV